MSRKPMVDNAGQLAGYRPAEHVKPQGFVRRIANRIASLWRPDVPHKVTTEQGASAAASPTLFPYELISQRYERRQTILECRTMCLDDPRVRRSTSLHASEATRRGAIVTIRDAPSERIKKRSDKIMQDVVKIIQPKLSGWAWMLLIEGDLFLQAVVDNNNKLVDIKRMPATSMERKTDDADEFIDVTKAFAQVDIMTNTDVATFPLYLMHHERWCYIDGNRYGEPEIIAGRYLSRFVNLQEKAQGVRRMTRAALKTLWNIGTPENPSGWDEVEEFKEKLGFKEGQREIMDPAEVSRDFFGNGLISATQLEGDANMEQIEDLRYFQNLFASSALPVPPPIYNLDAQNINRDVLEDLRSEWLKSTQNLSEAMIRVVRWAIDLALLLSGIPEEWLSYEVVVSDASAEKPTVLAQRVTMLYEAELISLKQAVMLLAEVTGVRDIEEEIEAIKQEKEERNAEERELKTAGQTNASETRQKAIRSATSGQVGGERRSNSARYGSATNGSSDSLNGKGSGLHFGP